MPSPLRPALITLQRREWMRAHRMEESRREEIAAQVIEVLRSSRPLTARQLESKVQSGARSTGHWGWNWSDVKRVLEDLFVDGVVTSAGRTAQFERRYALAERVLVPDALPGPAGLPSAEEAALQLVRAAAPALGVATLASLADYYRIRQDQVRGAVGILEGTGELEPVRLQTWSGTERPAWRHAAARTPRTVTARALLNPFDPQVFHRPRVEELFGVRYRIGIYTPAAQRTRGYYPLLFLLGEHLVAQVDLAAERVAGRLSVRGVWSEQAGPDGGRSPLREISRELVEELAQLAGWLGLGEVVMAPEAPGDLVPEVTRALRELSGNRP